jgi:hypothetical protein
LRRIAHHHPVPGPFPLHPPLLLPVRKAGRHGERERVSTYMPRNRRRKRCFFFTSHVCDEFKNRPILEYAQGGKYTNQHQCDMHIVRKLVRIFSLICFIFRVTKDT